MQAHETQPRSNAPAVISSIQDMPKPTTFEATTARMTKDGLSLEIHVLAEIVPGSGLVKRGVVKPNIPSFGAFELYCDEGSSIGGTNTAPAPLSYLAAGVAFCMLTHLKGYADSAGLKVTSIRIEQRLKFQSRIPGMTAPEGSEMEGVAEGLETAILVESDEPAHVIRKMVETAERACMATQAIVTAVPNATAVRNNGERLA